MPNFIKLGQTVPSLSIPRLDVANGFSARALVVDPDLTFFKYQAYDDRVKRMVELDQDSALELKLNPYTAYYMLVARLNTDLNGRIASDSFELQYLRMSEKVYQSLSRQIEENPNFTHIVISKGPKQTNEQGRDVSEVKYEVSSRPLDSIIPNALVRLQEIKAKPDFLRSCCAFIDSSTSISVEEYRQRLQAYYQQNSASAPLAAPGLASRPAPLPSAPVTASVPAHSVSSPIVPTAPTPKQVADPGRPFAGSDFASKVAQAPSTVASVTEDPNLREFSDFEESGDDF